MPLLKSVPADMSASQSPRGIDAHYYCPRGAGSILSIKCEKERCAMYSNSFRKCGDLINAEANAEMVTAINQLAIAISRFNLVVSNK